MAMLIQTLSVKLGIARGKNLGEVCRDELPQPVVWDVGGRVVGRTGGPIWRIPRRGAPVAESPKDEGLTVDGEVAIPLRTWRRLFASRLPDSSW